MLEIAAIAFTAVFIGGLTKGVTGFGYAVTGTALLASFIPAKTAVVLMLPALIATNIGIAREKGFPELWQRIKEFRFFALSLVVGSIAGTLLIDFLPQRAIGFSVGLITLGYVVFKQELLEPDIAEKFKSLCLRSSHRYQELLGLSTGLIFGSSNVGVPIVAVAQRIEDSHEDFIALLSGLMIASIASRFITAYAIGLYRFESIFMATALILPGLLGLKSGEIVRELLDPDLIQKAVTVLLVVIGFKLVIG